MKTKEHPDPIRKPASRRKTTTKAALRHVSRPFHKRVFLHPVSVMILLCAGVIILGSTFPGLAATFDVTATVSAPTPSTPAFITSPYHQQHTPQPEVMVAGTCPAQSYVKLFRSTVFSGVGQCIDNSFNIQTTLTPGENELNAKVFNITNEEGPVSPPVIVYYDQISIAPSQPEAMPTEIVVMAVEASGYSKKKTPEASSRPTVTGFAPPLSDIIVTFHSDPVTCKTKADTAGWWSCTLGEELPQGRHRVEIVAITPEGTRLTFPSFHIQVVTSKRDLLLPTPANGHITILADYSYQTQQRGETFGWELSIRGGRPPYALIITWGDNSESKFTSDTGATMTITHAFPENKTYHPIVTVTDTNGVSASLQLSAVVPGLVTAVNTLPGKGEQNPLFAQVREYLWIVWPVYGAVLLMVLSFWLGELEVIRRMAEKRRAFRAGRPKDKLTKV